MSFMPLVILKVFVFCYQCCWQTA